MSKKEKQGSINEIFMNIGKKQEEIIESYTELMMIKNNMKNMKNLHHLMMIMMMMMNMII